jgi:hypothetical protein
MVRNARWQKLEPSSDMRFSKESLFAGSDSLHQYKEDACVQNYIALLEQRLRKEYPDAQIEIIPDASTTRTEVEVISEDENGTETMKDSSPFLDAEDIDNLAMSVYQEYDWVVKGDWQKIAQVSERFEIPAYNLRWACRENLIKGVEQVSGTWEFALETITAIKKNLPWLTYKRAIVITSLDFGDHEFLDCQEEIPNLIPEENQIILLNPNVLELSLFSDFDSLLTISRGHNYLRLEIEHFEDGRTWSDKR